MQKMLSIKTVIRFILALLLGFILFMIWWVSTAGLETVWRIITYDSSSIEDYTVFPA